MGAIGHIEEVDPTAAGEDIRRRWRDLAVARENPFLTPEWLGAWQEAGEGEPLVLAWRREAGGEVAGVLPLVRGGRAGRTLRFPGAGNGDWYGVAAAPEDEADALAALLGALRERSRGWDVLMLDRIPPPPPSPSPNAFGHDMDGESHSLGPGGPRLRQLRTDVLPFLELGEGGYEAWLASRSRNFRSQLGRRRRRAEKDHDLALADTPDAEAVEAAVERLFDLHTARRRMQGGEGVLSDEARRAYARFAALSHERGWLRMHSLSLDGETVASWYGWRLGARYLYGISGFDPAREGLAVGTVLLAHTIERAAAEGAAVYDLLWGEEAYKDRFATGRREVVSLAAAAGARGRLALGARRGADALARSLPDGARRRLRALRGAAGG